MKAKVMQRDTIANDMRLIADLLKRFADVREFMVVKRKVSNYADVFAAVNPALVPHKSRMHKVWRGEGRLLPTDADMVSEMEKAVELLNAA